MEHISSFRIPLDELYKLFELKPITSIRTSGDQSGVIIKFKTIYLKIYESNDNTHYIIIGGRYDVYSEIFKIQVSWNRIKDFARTITNDNYFINYNPHNYT